LSTTQGCRHAGTSPIYTLANCHPAYQLNWTLSIFWHQPPSAAEWLKALQAATELDGVRVLEHRLVDERMSQFLLSTKPAVSPHALVRAVKGRLQYLVRGERPKVFQRNYCLRSVESVTREGVEKYVGAQAGRHSMADPRVQAMFQRNQFCNPHVDSSRPREGHHAIYWYNLHIVLVHTERFREVCEERIAAARAMIVGVCEKQGYLLSHAGIVSDHVHLTLGGRSKPAAGRDRRPVHEQFGLSRGDETGVRVRVLCGDVWRVSSRGDSESVVANPSLRWGKPSGGGRRLAVRL
jgi:REP element-mobilizing transposase RayT